MKNPGDASEHVGNVGEGIEPTRTGSQSQEELTAAQSQQALEAAKKEGQEEVTFYDPEKVPEPLKPTFKELQKAFTQKTQEIAEVKKRAEAFDQLMANPKFQAWVQQNVLAEPEEGSPEEGIGEMGLPGSETEGYVDEETSKLTEIEKRQEQLETELAISRNEALLDKLAQQYPDFTKYMPEMYPLVQQGYPYEAAYYKAKFGKPESEVRKELRAEILREIEEEKKAKLEGVGTPSGMLSPTTAKTVREAFEKAKEEYERENK